MDSWYIYSMKRIAGIIMILGLMTNYAQNTVSGSISHSTGNRTYQLYVPASYDGTTAVPLVLNLHGYTSNNTQQMFYGDFKPIADTANFLILAPQGTNDGTGNAHWNANWATGVDDIGFLSALIDSLSADYNINADRVYSTGMSNGGFMSFTLAGQLSDKIAAVASVTGTMSILQIPANTLNRPMPIMQIHGTADATVDYNGDANFLSVDSVISYWVAHNNCNTTPVVTAVPDVNTTDGCTAERIDYLNGDNGAEVVHYKVTNGAHTWPGAGITIGVTNQDFDASTEIWKFFMRYEKSNFVSVNEINSTDETIKLISENPTNGSLQFVSESNELLEFNVFDLNGKSIMNTRSNGAIDISGFENGIYLINISSSNGAATFKVVKK